MSPPFSCEGEQGEVTITLAHVEGLLNLHSYISDYQECTPSPLALTYVALLAIMSLNSIFMVLSSVA